MILGMRESLSKKEELGKRGSVLECAGPPALSTKRLINALGETDEPRLTFGVLGVEI
jgi:hypothetical protein